MTNPQLGPFHEENDGFIPRKTFEISECEHYQRLVENKDKLEAKREELKGFPSKRRSIDVSTKFSSHLLEEQIHLKTALKYLDNSVLVGRSLGVVMKFVEQDCAKRINAKYKELCYHKW